MIFLYFGLFLRGCTCNIKRVLINLVWMGESQSQSRDFFPYREDFTRNVVSKLDSESFTFIIITKNWAPTIFIFFQLADSNIKMLNPINKRSISRCFFIWGRSHYIVWSTRSSDMTKSCLRRKKIWHFILFLFFPPTCTKNKGFFFQKLHKYIWTLLIFNRKTLKTGLQNMELGKINDKTMLK